MNVSSGPVRGRCRDLAAPMRTIRFCGAFPRRLTAACGLISKMADVHAFPHAAEPLPDFKAGHSNPPPSTDLFSDGCRMTPARFPNAGEGWLQVTNLVGKTQTDSRQRVSTMGDFQTDLEDLSPWADEPDLRATGYWFVYWSDASRHRQSEVGHAPSGREDGGAKGRRVLPFQCRAGA